MLLTEGYTVACFDVRAAALEETKAAILAEAGAGGEKESWSGRIHPFTVDVSWIDRSMMVCTRTPHLHTTTKQNKTDWVVGAGGAGVR